MFSNMEKKEYMESELCDNFRVKVAAKNVLLGSLETYDKLLLQCDIYFWRNIQIFRIKLLHLSVSLLSSTIVSFMWNCSSSFGLVIEHILLLFPGNLFYAINLKKYFVYMKVNRKILDNKTFWRSKLI